MTQPEEEVAPSDQLDPTDRDLEAPRVDAAEQATPVAPVEDPIEVRRGWDVGEWDAFEQSIVVDLDDDYDR